MLNSKNLRQKTYANHIDDNTLDANRKYHFSSPHSADWERRRRYTVTPNAMEVQQRRADTKHSGYLYLLALVGSVISVSRRMASEEDFFLRLFSSAEAISD